MSNKMGESQIIDFFSSYMKDVFRDEFGKNGKYSIGNFSGSQDRKFADFFAGTDSNNILIEFKEFRNETSAEKEKPLRKKLCQTLTNNVALLSRSCHFIGWGKRQSSTEVEFSPYIDCVCRFWGAAHLKTPDIKSHGPFVNCFINGKLGVTHSQFIMYIEHLNSIAGGDEGGGKVGFKSILYSRGKDGRLLGTRFDSLDELNKLRQIKKPRSGIKPK